MNKKTIIVVIMVLVLAVIGAVIYFVMQSNKQAAPVKTTSSQLTGLSSLLSNIQPGNLTALLGLI